MAEQNAAHAAGKQPRNLTQQEIDKMINDRQKVTDDLAHLTQQMRSATRELAPTQPAASGKLRSALDGMDENQLGERLQRSSDWLHNYNFSDQAESALTSDLQKRVSRSTMRLTRWAAVSRVRRTRISIAPWTI